jgi:myb proto-oncogene protein
MSTRGHWRPAEDEKLRKLVDQYGPHNWNSIAEKLQGKSGENLNFILIHDFPINIIY